MKTLANKTMEGKEEKQENTILFWAMNLNMVVTIK